MNTCCAILNGGICLNIRSGDSDHCEHHRPKAISLYHKYKEICDICDKLDICKIFESTEDLIEHLLKCYNLFNKAFNARMKHRNYAFAPEYQDKGHNYQFIKLKNQMLKCETILEELYNKSQEISKDNIVEYTPTQTLIIIKKSREHRIKVEEDFNVILNKYIEENNDTIDKRRSLINNITVAVLKTFYPHYKGSWDLIPTISPQFVSLFSLWTKLSEIGYFTGQFSKNDLTEHMCYEIILATDRILDIDNMYEYCAIYSEDTLKQFFKDILLNKNLLYPLSIDVELLIKEYCMNALFMKLYLYWAPELQNFCIITNPLPKVSFTKMFSNLRLKKQYQHKTISTIQNVSEMIENNTNSTFQHYFSFLESRKESI